ncbi:sensor histidine kinase [Cohnella sp. GCM10027633]|uniref:sensor histidine kinase n=1 Tax=unclassified Cohnella TaxID=2636738 RepID=UPI0036414259
MGQSNRKWHKSIYFRLIVAFVVAMLPIYLLAGFLYQWGTSMLRNDIVESAETQSTNYVNELENTFKRFNALQYETMNDDMLIRLMGAYDVLEPYRRIELINSIRSKLFSIKNSSEMIADVHIYVTRLGIQISAVDGYSELDERKLSVNLLRSPYKVIFERNTLLMVAYPLESSKDGLPDLIVEVELSEREIRQTLQSAIGRDYTGAIYLGLSDERHIIIVQKPELSKRLDSQESSVGTANGRGTMDIATVGNDYIRVSSAITETGIFADQYLYKKTMFHKVTKHIQWFWLFFVVAFIAVAFFLFYINRAINKPLVKIVRAFRYVEEGNFDFTIRHDTDDEFGYMYVRYNEMLVRLKALIDEVYNQQLQRQNAELKQLQSQINPHFLYNCLFSITRLIKMDKFDEAIRFTDQLARYFRFITRSTRDTVPLEQEVEHARNYVMLQLARFSDRVSVSFEEVPDRLKPIGVPRLIMQPLVENAFVHGLENVDEGGLLRVSFSARSDGAIISVEDNGDDAELQLARMNEVLQEVDYSQEVTAILNIHRRLLFMFGAGSGLQVERSELGGVKVSMIIKWNGGESDVPDVDR